MLILSRKPEEEIVIYNSDTDEVLATIKVLDIQYSGDRVRIGFEAPDHIAIDRSEIYEAKHGQNGNGSRTRDSGNPRPARKPLRRTYRGD